MATEPSDLAVCVDNSGYEAALELPETLRAIA
jgi:hypothetical protein